MEDTKYRVVELLGEGEHYSFYRAALDDLKSSCLVKKPGGGAGSKGLALLSHEYDVCSRLEVPGILRPVEKEMSEKSPVIFFEDPGGTTLELLLQKKPLTLDLFFPIAIELAEIIGRLHRQQIIHKDIHSGNVVVCQNDATQRVFLTGFGVATSFSDEAVVTSNANLLDGTLSTMSPELTGRINRSVDYRTDFYSLGVVMYSMLAGQLPFEFESYMEMVYAHLAKEPPDLVEINPDLPGMVVKLIMKLLSKDAEDRYHSAGGIVADLKQCLDEYQKKLTIPDFELAQEDVSQGFIYPGKLYGREEELSRLDAIFQRICGGSVELVLISGAAGIGKTELVHHLRPSIGQKNGYLMKGKSDLMSRTPYFSFIQAISDGFDQLLMQPQEIIQRVAQAWFNTLGENARALTDGIPSLKTVLGELPSIPELPPEQARNRFHLAVRKMLRAAISLRGRPIVIFLDDLQWADQQTIKMVEALCCDLEQRSLLLVGTYRDDEVYEEHPLSTMKSNIISAGGKLSEIALKPLEINAIHRLLHHAFTPLNKSAGLLAETCLKKAGGNPFFIRQLLNELVDSGSVFLDSDTDSWEVKKEEVERWQIAENVVDYLTVKLKGLDRIVLKTLESASCIGTVFDLDTLKNIHKKSSQECLELLWPAVIDQYITLVQGDRKLFITQKYNGSRVKPQLLPDVSGAEVRFRFVHDRLYETIYNQLSLADKIEFHLRIGRYWQSSRQQAEFTESLHDILGQLNKAIPSLQSYKEKKDLALLNMRGGTIAQENSHFETAFEYFKTGIDLLGARGWQEEYKATRDLHNKGTQAAFLSGGYDELHRWFDALKREAISPLDCVDGYIALMQKEMTQHNLQQGIAKGLEILELLGVSLSAGATSDDFIIELDNTETLLSDYSISDIMELPVIAEEESLAVMRVMFAMMSACYLADRILHHLLVLKFVQITLSKGISIFSSMIFCTLGFILNVFPDKVNAIKRYGQIGLSFLEIFKDQNAKVRTTFLYNMGIASLKVHVRETIDGLVADQRRFAELGNFVHTGNTHYIIEHLRFLQGIPLEILFDNISNSLENLAKIRHKAGTMLLLPLQQMILNLLGRSEHTTQLIGEAFDERSLNWQDRTNETLLASVYQLKMILAYHFDHFEEAEKWLEKLESTGAQINIPSLYAQSLFYRGLYSLSLVSSRSADKLGEIDEKTYGYQEKLGKLAESAPMNFAHMYNLLKAERARLRNDNEVAEQCYEEAIEDARMHGYLHEEALANELAAKYFAGIHKKAIGRMFMRRAAECYLQWGAQAKVEFLKKKYHDLAWEGNGVDSVDGANGLEPHYVGEQSPQNDFDLMSGLRASRAISGEVELDRLLETLMNVVMENIGATKGCFLLPEGDKLFLSAVADMVQSDAISYRADVMELHEASDLIPSHIVNSVCHTREMVVLNDAREDDLFRFDPYIQAKQPRAILCTPLVRKELLMGVLYLENNLLSGAFSKDKLQMVEILSAQIGVSLENAIFYEEKLKAETALFAEKERLAVTLKSIGEGVITTDVHGVTTLLNTIAEELTGWSSSEAEGKPLHEIFPIFGELGASKWRDLADRVILANRPIELPENVILKTKNETQKFITASCSPIHDSTGSTIGTVVVFKDVTDKRHMEERIQHAQKMEAVGTFAGGIAHDFNNILTPVIGYSEILLKMKENDPKIRDSLFRIYQAGTRGRDVVRQILLLGRKQEKKMAPVRLQDIVQEVEQLYSSMLPASIELTLDVDWGCSPVLADATQIHQVLMNLIANANHAITTSIGQITIHLQELSPDTVRVELLKTNSEKAVLLSVQDSGSGMSPEVRKRIFDPYFTTKDSDKGTGLGLATSHGIIEEHNGYIEVESALGVGSIFRIILPALSEDSGRTQDESGLQEDLVGSARILFVDDESAIASLGQDIIESLGYTVTTCTDSVKALEIFQNDPDEFDVIITDMTLPKLTGDLLAHEICSIRPQIPIIACSGYSERLNKMSKDNNPFICSLQKPFSREDLARAIKKALSTKL